MRTFLTVIDERLDRWSPSRRARALILVGFATSVTLQITGIPLTSSFGTRTRIDLDVYRLGAQIWQQGQSLYATGSMPFTTDGIWLPFTYPPFAALTFVPLGAMTLAVSGILISLLTIALLVVIVHIVLRLLAAGTNANRWWLALIVVAAGVWSNPVWMTLGFGQINVILLAMIVVDIFVLGRGRLSALGPARGVLVGLAAAIKLTPLVFIAVFACARQWRAAITTAATFVLAGGLAWIWLPGDSLGYWTHTLFHTTRIGDPAGRINQNLNALWIRLLAQSTSAQHLAWVGSSLAVTALAAAAVASCHPERAFSPAARPTERVNSLLAACAVAVWGLLVSPTSWAHHWVWSIPSMLACAVVAARTSERTARIAYASLAASGLVIFALGPFQFLSAAVRQWSLLDHVLGNAYSLWGITALLVLWRLPFASHPDGTAPADRQLAEIHST
ncbi:MAG: glycosyltransferase 87 family protein [Gordonia sp. (in: high G+C Gram-positive bacteria)]